LIIAADFEAGARLSKQLHDCGYSCTVARRNEGLRAVGESEPHFVVLDHDSSDVAGWIVLVRIAEITNAPIIVLGDDSVAGPTIEALRLGAAAFLGRPPSEEELCFRVAGALRRSAIEPREGPSISDDFFQIDLVDKSASVFERRLNLKPTEYRMLVAFARHPEMALDHDRILELVWPDGFQERGIVKLYVSYLRRAVAKVAPVDPVKTVSGVGYRYEPRQIC
jgi:DNA-binding response OmpR family regulator